MPASAFAPSFRTIDVASLMFARLFDRRPLLLEAIRAGAPVIVIDIADPAMLDRVAMVWREVLFPREACLMDVARDDVRPREDLDAVYLALEDPPKRTSKVSLETTSLSMLAFALPFIAISPLGRSHLPEAVNSAATERIQFPRMDRSTVARTIRIVTGRPCRESAAGRRDLSIDDLRNAAGQIRLAITNSALFSALCPKSAPVEW